MYEEKYGMSEADLNDLNFVEDENLVRLSKKYARISKKAAENFKDDNMVDEEDYDLQENDSS